MIVSHVRHGRTARDVRNLARHLLQRDDNATVEIASIVGLVAGSLPEALAAMRRLAPHSGAAAFHHVALSPSESCMPQDLRADADRIVREMGADPETHPHVLVLHGKGSPAGRGELHGHLVASHWGLDGRAVADSWLHLRLERVAREIEHDRGQALTAGRHDQALVKALRAKGRSEVATALDLASPPELPRSALTPGARQRIRRAGISDVQARAAVEAAWQAADSPVAFRAALAGAGLSVVPGNKSGVHLITTQEGVQVGALDRILRMKRAEVAARMERLNETGSPAADPVAARPRNPGSDADHRQQDREAPCPSRLAGRARGRVAAGSAPGDLDRGARGDAGNEPTSCSDRAGHMRPGSDGSPARGRGRRVRDAAAVQALAAGLNMEEIKAEAERRFVARRIAELRRYHDAARVRLGEARQSLPIPLAVTQARMKAERAENKAGETRKIANQAADERARIDATEPRGWRRLLAWATGDLRRHRHAAVKAAEAVNRAADWRDVMDRLAAGARFAVEVEEEKAQRRRASELARRRKIEEAAMLAMERARTAATMLRQNPTLASLPTPDLMSQAEAERRQREVDEREREAREAERRAPRPGSR